MIPENVVTEIIERAKRDWPGNEEMQEYCINGETDGYNKIQQIDFGNLSKKEIIDVAKEMFSAWDDVYEMIKSEVLASRELLRFSVEGLSQENIDEWRDQARKEHQDSYEDQLIFLHKLASKHAAINTTREQVDPIKSLLIELEEIIGDECYNGNTQNYASWGELDSIGRKFRYPVNFYTDSAGKKEWTVPLDVSSEELITGYYKFGANELNIYRALFKIVSHLREKYDLKV
jgi:hemoglobin-like flavoprotein